MPPETPLIIGDAVQCLRNALDHIVFALAQQNASGQAIPPDKEDKIQFPFRDEPCKGIPGGIARLAPAAQDVIVKQSPGGVPTDFDSQPLWFLNKLSNRDKHRSIPVTTIASWPRELNIGNGYIDSLETFSPQLELGQKGLVVEVGPGTKVNAHISISVVAVFDPALEVGGMEVIWTLERWYDYINSTILPPLENLLS